MAILYRTRTKYCNKRIYVINKTAGSWMIHKVKHPLMSTINRLATGHHMLNASRSNITGCSCLCLCGEPETFYHYIYHCERYSRYRIILLNKINNIMQIHHISLVYVPIELLFGQAKDKLAKNNISAVKAFLEYLQSTNRFS